MEAVTFSPQTGDLYTTLLVCLLAIAFMVYLGVRAGRRSEPDPRKRVLLPMLAYFGALLALMTLLGSFWTILKYPEVTVTATSFVVDGEEYPLPSAGNVRMEAVGKGVNTTGRVLLVQTKDRKNWAFPDDRYDTRKLYGLLRREEE